MEYRNGYIEGLVTILGAMRSHCTRYKLISVTKSHVLDWERQGQGRMEYRNGYIKGLLTAWEYLVLCALTVLDINNSA